MSVVDLDRLAAQIRSDYEAAKRGSLDSVDRQFAVGHALLTARDVLPEDREYGRWFRSQDFGFSTQWGALLRRAAEREPEVRVVVESQLSTGRTPSIERALAALRVAEQAPSAEPGPLPDGIYRTIVADPPWQYSNKATRGSAENHYKTMGLDEIAGLDIESRTAADAAHLYLWTTNSFMREAFDIATAWGFVYKTLLTWVKSPGFAEDAARPWAREPEEWRVVPGFEDYEVSSRGNVRRRGSTEPLAPVSHPQGYLAVSLGADNKRLIHRIVAEAFLGIPPAQGGWEVNHVDGVKANNHAANLEWLSHRENMNHAVEIGLPMGRPANGTSKAALSRQRRKLQLGLGNYYRSVTEHVLFCTRGKTLTLQNDISNVIEAPRGQHSAKPDCFYDLVERQSPGPFLELFARRQRLGWSTWGNECFEHVLVEASA